MNIDATQIELFNFLHHWDHSIDAVHQNKLVSFNIR